MDAIVAAARDDMIEPETVGAAQGSMPLENTSGNYLVFDIGEGRYVFYERLKHGSIQVRPGDKVTSGQVIALLGNSGSSSSGPRGPTCGPPLISAILYWRSYSLPEKRAS